MNKTQQKSGEMHRQFKECIINIRLDEKKGNIDSAEMLLYVYVFVLCDSMQIKVFNSSESPTRDLINVYTHLWAILQAQLVRHKKYHESLWLSGIFRQCFAIFLHGKIYSMLDNSALILLDSSLEKLSKNTKFNRKTERYVKKCMKKTSFSDALDIADSIKYQNFKCL